MGATGPRRWRPSAHARLLHSVWDEEWVCHHELSNDTHRLSELAGRALMALAVSTPQEEPVLASTLDTDVGTVAEVLDTLESLNFIERCP